MATCEREVARAWVHVQGIDMGDCVVLPGGNLRCFSAPIVRVVGMSPNVEATVEVGSKDVARIMADDHVRLRLALIEVRDDGEGD